MFYPVDEIRLKNGKNGQPLWIVIRDAVYDVSKFLKQHPGGPEVIQEYAGLDATSAFDAAGHPSSVKKELNKYYIGETKWKAN